ncbi:hypothetical protein JR316_0006033 [Psilocybe cubensis]|uniref:Uncharacterized protein n=2 Tax=Psilocybe cubensis TaxID=181762 RepID=A0A8H7Y0C4_PSICU|nr:hypothetical protein JR316_0006033 [Psilocybe cubensis]KAH9481506.1 hypothetical protein JR316_0006033 [Psilocybe cubensis]
MALAQRLNELAVANSQGLLNDDEYRLLRQSVFEQHASTVVVPVEAPVVPIARVHVQVQATSQSHRRPSSKPTNDPPKPSPHALARPKSSVNLGVANLIRRATGRKPNPSPAVHDTPTNRKDARKPNEPVAVTPVPKRSVVLPRLHSKKPPELPPIFVGGSQPLSGLPSKGSTSQLDVHYSLQSPPLSPSSSSMYYASPTSPRHPENSSSMNDVFDDDNLETAKDFRAAIAITEDEALRLIDAFNNLELSTLRRIQKQNARRLPTTTPTHIGVVMEGQEWREHRLVPSPSSPLLNPRQHRTAPSVEMSNSDGKSLRSVRSGSSHATSLSQSRSISSLPKAAPASPLSSHFRAPSFSLARKSSISSTSSRSTSLSSSGMLSVLKPLTHHRSTSRLALHRETDSQAMASTDTIARTALEDADEDPELSDIRKRREDLINRYTARIEYLRAKLKSAELHEKLLRK